MGHLHTPDTFIWCMHPFFHPLVNLLPSNLLLLLNLLTIHFLDHRMHCVGGMLWHRAPLRDGSNHGMTRKKELDDVWHVRTIVRDRHPGWRCERGQ